MGAIITITGKSGAGKSTVLSNLACAFASNDACVAALSCDLRYQSLPHFFSGEDIPPTKSLGMLFGSTDLKDKLVEYPQMRNIFIAAPAAGESCIAYEPPDAEGIAAFLVMLAGTFDFVIIEAGEVIFNQFSMLSCRSADVLINIAEASAQGIAWESSSLDMLASLRPGSGGEDIITVANDPCDSGLLDKITNADMRISYSRAVRDGLKKGIPILIDPNAGFSARSFRREIDTLYMRIMERMATS